MPVSLSREALRKVAPSKAMHTRPPHYKVVLHNDVKNRIGYVVSILPRVIKDMNYNEAYAKTMEAHEGGSSVLRVCAQELAEDYCEGLRVNGLRASIQT